MLYRPPQALAAIDFLPAALPGAWSKEDEPKSDVAALYADLKTGRGKPWPENIFLDGINSAIGQGFIPVASGSARIDSLKHDGKKALTMKRMTGGAEPTPERAFGGRRRTNMVTLGVADVQTLSDEIHHITKLLAGCDPVIEACISIKPKPGMDTKEIDEVLKKIKKEWTF
jgi:hypothetical protein